MIVDELLIDCPEIGKDKIVTMVKERESYVFTNLLSVPITYNINRKSCGLDVSNGTGNIDNNGKYIFTPEREGEFIVSFSDGDKKQTIIFTHYPTIIKSIIKNVSFALCHNEDDCGCGCDKEGKECLTYQSVFAETQLLLGLFKGIPNCSGKDVIREFLYHSLDAYRCDLISLFCDKELELKLKGQAEFSSKLTKKLIAINFLALYFYELWITNPLPEYVKFVNDKYKFNTLKNCLLASGIDVFILQTIFDQITAPCDDEPIVCPIGCFKNITTPDTLVYNFNVGEVLNGIYHTVTLMNSCAESVIFMNRVIYKDDTFKVQVKSTSNSSFIDILPGGTVDVDIYFIGTKNIPSVINLPFKFDNILINTYQINFNSQETPNRPPIITDIIKELANRTPYTFTVLDFESHFTDLDGDILDRIVIVGDVSRFTLNGVPYQSGTEINRNNITNLVYTPLDTDTVYSVVLDWMAYDSYGLPSN